MKTIELIERHAKSIARGDETVKPGMPWSFTEAAEVGDGCWQGDLGIEIVAKVPKDYAEVKHITAADLQLVPGNTQGSRHCLLSSDGIRLFRPADWGNEESLAGPCLVCEKEATITHPTHGEVKIPSGFTVKLRYQRVWEAEQRKERRARD